MRARLLLCLISAISLFSVHSLAHAATLSLSNVPLYLGGSVEPNIVLTLDDSGSMQWENMPDDNWTYFLYPRASGVYGPSTYDNYVPRFEDISYSVRIRSSHNNKIYYNPEVTYVPWSNADGSSMGNVSPSCAPHNPDDTSLGCRNLTRNNRQYAYWEYYNGNEAGFPAGVSTSYSRRTFWPAVYYRYTGGNTWDVSSYQKVEIRSGSNYTGGSGRDDCANAPVCTYAEEIQNFANWYSYYRSRILASRAGIGRAFGQQGQGMRVGFATINQGGRTVDNVWSDQAMVDGVRNFNGTNRSNFFNRLYGWDITTSGTPLRSATKNVGDYFERTDNRGPWGETPGTNDTTDHLTCRQSYNILMTDGYWNGSAPSVGNSDNNAGAVISGPNNDDYQYSPSRPYLDSWSNTLADVAMDFWKRDLRTDLDNEVPTNDSDPAFWQHMVTFTVGLGVNGTLDPDTDLPALQAGTLDWPQPSADAEENIDDLWHAAVNSRGQFFSAADPDTFASSLSSILSNISERSSSASSVALNSGTLASGSLVYQAKFNSGDWTGQLLAYAITTDGSLNSSPSWDAADLIPAHSNRQIFTYDGTDGQPFLWGNLSASQQTALGSQSVLNYLRGDQSSELSNGGSFRNRTSLLGDIIHSSPSYAAMPLQRYPDNWGAGAAENASPYSTFKSTHLNRQAMIYVGANDGMLHAFRADTGVEVFSFVPSSLYSNLSDLTVPGYNHRYYVDETPTIVDAFINGSWRTILVSGLGAGGQSIFALDVTDPLNFDETDVLWEFTDSSDSDLGYSFGQPSIVRMQNGDWAAIFSGGYNNNADNAGDGSSNDSNSGNAVLYIVNLEDGSLITSPLDTETGTAEDPTGANRPNGLSTPAVVDIDSDAIADLIYAGDLFGNVWKIDVSDSNPSKWDFAMKARGKPAPLYSACVTATCSSTNRQPITTQPQIINHPTGNGYLVLFGTGQYMEVGDNSASGQVTQSFYGIWDKNLSSFSAFDKDDLLQQSITEERSQSGFDLRITTMNSIDWDTQLGWYLDLINPSTSANEGERQVSEAIVRNGRVIFTTLLPSDDPCDFGGSGWLMELDAYTGSRLGFSPFDINGDRVFSTADYVNVGDIDGDGIDDFLPASGKKSDVGIIPKPGIVNDDDGQREFKYTPGSTGEIEVTVENPGPGAQGRQSWRQLDFLFRRN